MIKIQMQKNGEGALVGFTVIGHAGYADSGKDIICASVSALVINTVNSVEKLTEDKFSYEEDERKGYASFSIQASSPSAQVSLLLSSLSIGLHGIAASYPAFVKVKD